MDPENIGIKNATTDQLVEELVCRGAKKVDIGSYCEYQLKRKYSNTDRSESECNVILLPFDTVKEHPIDIGRLTAAIYKAMKDAMNPIAQKAIDDSTEA